MILTHKLLIVLTGFAVSTLQTTINTTEIYTSTTEEYSDSSETYANTTTKAPHNDSLTAQLNSHLLQGLYLQLQCLRLYSEVNRRGYWSDMCDSNEALSPLQVWSTGSLCTPGYQLHGRSSYWLIYEYNNFRGRYLLLSPDMCIYNVHRYGIRTTSSILKCVQINPYYSSLYCEYPPQPWRQSSGLSENPPSQLPNGEQASYKSSSSQETLMQNVDLSDLQQSSLNGNDS
ncbi:unnamed protein product [Trichobilharzia regenti]|uniref:IL4_i_Ig domain-containing protein n=1 Tax=Trichobilharzia regenti TaxID=157069 RepID=A0A183VUM9_TRIRE|nr:unnamed protein product [Trichobilharzia regenti]VDQ00065.1 unnamed protein product [Trichobilharzia regenti]